MTFMSENLTQNFTKIDTGFSQLGWLQETLLDARAPVIHLDECSPTRSLWVMPKLFNVDAIVHGGPLKRLLAAAGGCLDRDESKEELDLVHFASGGMARLRAGAAVTMCGLADIRAKRWTPPSRRVSLTSCFDCARR